MKCLRISSAVAGALVVLLVVSAAMAAEHAAGGGGHHYNWMDLAKRLVNFAIFGFLLWKFAGKKAIDFFSSRRYNIEQELKDLDARKVEASNKLKDVEASIANLEAERAAILADYKAQGERIKATIIEKAQKSADQITEQAAKTASNEAKMAIEGMREEMAELIIDAAEAIVRKQLKSKDAQEALVDKYLTKVVFN